MIVMKFGGTSVGDGAAMLRATEIVQSRRDRHPVVVVSAMSGVTDKLLQAARACTGRWQEDETPEALRRAFVNGKSEAARMVLEIR